jgi:hypothetical protein
MSYIDRNCPGGIVLESKFDIHGTRLRLGPRWGMWGVNDRRGLGKLWGKAGVFLNDIYRDSLFSRY